MPPAALSADEAIVADALLAPSDLEGNWVDGGSRLLFPNSIELAGPLVECEGLADVVFAGGSDHGVGQSRVLTKNMSPVFLYTVIFPTEDQAAEMMRAVSSTEFDECWAAFNEVAVPAMPLGMSGASYESKPPPIVAVDADALNVEYLVGSVETGSGPFDDTCVCVFAQVGRGVVEVHSTEPTLTPDERAVVVQAAVDKLRSALE